eukprot:scaffold6054_cov142-Skeletonema_marinoi.AAC.1
MSKWIKFQCKFYTGHKRPCLRGKYCLPCARWCPPHRPLLLAASFEMKVTSNTRLIEWVTDKYRSYNPYISFKLHLYSYNNLFIVILVFEWVCIDILVQKDRINQQPSSITTAARYRSDRFDQRLERKLRTCDSMS